MKKFNTTFRSPQLGILLVALIISQTAFSTKTPGSKKGLGSSNVIAAGCTPATSYTDLEINNVKTTIGTGGSLWFNPNIEGSYEIPRGSGLHSMYFGGLWIGGKDVSGQLKVAALDNQQRGQDFWPGPLGTETFEIDATTCAAYDKHFSTTRQEVKEFAAWYACSNDPLCDLALDFPNYTIPNSIMDWPAHGRNYDPYNEDFYLAPFYDANDDGIYNPLDGDYPGYDVTGRTKCGDNSRKTDIYGDANLWWVFNDKGNVHTSSSGNSIGMEIRAQAFAFASNDEVNNMTFYNFELINRSSFTLTETYFGVYADADLGGAGDDYVGCDVARGLGYAYNGDNVDDQALDNEATYGENPPAIGIDFFEGPYQDNDGKDNLVGIGPNEALNGFGYGDGTPDNERFGMRRFLYFTGGNNDCCNDPKNATDYYNYLRGIWRNNSPMTHGGTGIGGSIETNFMFPGNSDPLHWGTNGIDPNDSDPNGWTEETENNPVGDRRFVQSAGPFTLLPGAVNDITVGVVWARATEGGNRASIDALLKADEKTQNLFDNCFQLLEGPDAPILTAQELNREILLYIDNPKISNNYNEGYSAADAAIVIDDTLHIYDNEGNITGFQILTASEKTDMASYKFQGYKVYQVKDQTVDASSLNDIDKARLIYQCDIRDDVTKIINYEFDQDLGSTVATEMVDGSNEGIKHSLQILEDQFATGDRKLINYKTYCFMAVAYAHNDFKHYDPNNPDPSAQQTPYLESKKSPLGAIRAFCFIPRTTGVEYGGTIAQARFGEGVELTRIEGIGNGGNNLELKQESLDKVMEGAPWKVANPTYKKHAGPLEIKVIDPLNVVADEFTVQLQDSTLENNLDDAYWAIWRNSDPNNTKLFSVKNINTAYEQLIPEWGISVLVEQTEKPGENTDGTYGFIDASISFADESKPWLIGVSDVDADSLLDWISVGAAATDWESYENHTPYEGILDGSWAPARLCSDDQWGPIPDRLSQFTSSYFAIDELMGDLSLLSSVDIILTDDQSKWTRCPVIEMGANPADNKGELGVEPYLSVNGTEIPGALKGRLRQSPSVDKEGNAYSWPTDSIASSNENDPNYIAPYGMGWFPGYAINIETGERLNMAFGENSMGILEGENGSDMIWNPTDRLFDNGPFQGARLGGQHFIYVFRNNTIRQGERRAFYEDKEDLMPPYDAGQFSFSKLSASTPTGGGVTPPTSVIDSTATHVYGACMWVGYPLLSPGAELLATETTIKLRVRKPFQTYGTETALKASDPITIGNKYWVNSGSIIHNEDTFYHGEYFTAVSSSYTSLGEITDNMLVPSENFGLPLYNFNTLGLETLTNEDSVALGEMDNIKIVPNPYYAFSEYETGRLDNRIKIINLPDECTISIYSINGTLIRRLGKDDPEQTWIDWDLKNNAFIPIASGTYLFHVKSDQLGEERVLKWFGALRPTDLDAF